VWAIERRQSTDGSTQPATATLADLDGQVLGSVELPGEAWALGAIDDRVVLSGPGGVYVVDAAGDVSRISTGDALGVVGDRIFASNCDEELRCRTEVLDTDGELLEQLPAQLGNVGWAAAAPDGRLAYTEYLGHLGLPNRVSIDGEMVFEEQSSDIAGSGPGALAWSPDGRWLAFSAMDGVHFLDTLGGTGERVIDVGFVEAAGNLLFVAPDG
jgi:hypothetical protein